MTDTNCKSQHLTSPKYQFLPDSPTVSLYGKGKQTENFPHLVHRLLTPLPHQNVSWQQK